ncbi:hypothetical protein Naga_100070g17 [Nannochloropsis gaditana]|uniref:Uncharacterized protein n=1 Tax=Nannochloropsis gaditana TaxID=72520 RepID=W7TEJ1_9STRA|nr:hypothetical protein Naga_100070g17 [Nannochloropsis gaditana]
MELLQHGGSRGKVRSQHFRILIISTMEAGSASRHIPFERRNISAQTGSSVSVGEEESIQQDAHDQEAFRVRDALASDSAVPRIEDRSHYTASLPSDAPNEAHYKALYQHVAEEGEDVLLLLEEREALRQQLAAEKCAREDLEKLKTVEAAMERTTQMYRHAKHAAQRCSEDANQAMVELRESHALQSKLHASLDAAVHQLYRLRLTVQAEESGTILRHEEHKNEGDLEVGLEASNASSQNMTDAERRAAVVIHLLERLQNRPTLIQLRSDTVKRCYFGLWRLCLLQKWQDDGWQGTLAQVDNEISSVADGNVRKVVDSCVNLVQDILHQPGLHQRLQGQHQRGQYSPPTSTSLGDALSQPPWHLLGEDFRGHRVLARDVGSQPRSQTQREVQDVLLDILATYEKILLNETDFDRIDGLDETNDKWESNSLSSWSADEGLTGGEGSLTGVDGGKGGYVGRDGERNTAGSTYLSGLWQIVYVLSILRKVCKWRICCFTCDSPSIDKVRRSKDEWIVWRGCNMCCQGRIYTTFF